MQIALPQLQSWRYSFTKAVKKSDFSGGFGLVLKNKPSVRLLQWSINKWKPHHVPCMQTESHNRRSLQFTSKKRFVFLVNTTASPELRQRWQWHWKGYCKPFIICQTGQCWRKLQNWNNRKAIRLETEKGGWAVSTGRGQKPGFINLEKIHAHTKPLK